MIAGVVIAFTAGFYPRDILLTTTDDDFRYQVMLIPAKELTAPLPGKNYARAMDTEYFDPVSICSKQVETNFSPKVNFSGVNVIGVAFNNALDATSFLLSSKVTNWVKVEDPSKDWKMSVMARMEYGIFERDCWTAIEERLRDPNIQVFTVTNVYFEGRRAIQSENGSV
ncbi:MAG: hypothetical protein ACI9BH_002431 [Paracoccaceae bacterium]|jgi:hypothetical protein